MGPEDPLWWQHRAQKTPGSVGGTGFGWGLASSLCSRELFQLPPDSLEPNPGVYEAGIINPAKKWVGDSKEEEAAPQKWEKLDGEISCAPYLLNYSCKPRCLCVVSLKKVQPVPSDVWNL